MAKTEAQETGEVIPMAGKMNAPVELSSEMAALAAEYSDTTVDYDSDQLIIPRINILQDLSPQIKNGPDQVDGATVGQFFNPVYNVAVDEMTVIPIFQQVRYLAWRPRTAGGGLVASHLSKAEVEANFQQTGLGQWKGFMKGNMSDEPERVEVKETPEWVFLTACDAWGWEPASISFNGSHSQRQRALNTALMNKRERMPDGTMRRMSQILFASQMTSELVTNAMGSWYTFKFSAPQLHNDPEAARMAGDLARSIKEGAAVLDEAAAAEHG